MLEQPQDQAGYWSVWGAKGYWNSKPVAGETTGLRSTRKTCLCVFWSDVSVKKLRYWPEWGTRGWGRFTCCELWDLSVLTRFHNWFFKGSRKSKIKLFLSHIFLDKIINTHEHTVYLNDCILLLLSFFCDCISYSYTELSSGCYCLLYFNIFGFIML